MSELKKSTTHVVVQFAGEKGPNGKQSIDLVPRTWLKYMDGKWMCYFPEEKDWPKVDRWTRICKSPEEEWKTSEIKILKEAADYEQGIRRLKKTYTTLSSTAEETEVEIEQENNIVALDKDASLAALDSVPIFIPTSDIPSTYNMISNETNNGTIRNNNNDHVTIDRFERFERTFKHELENIKRSLLYDMHKSISDIKNMIMLNAGRPFGTLLTECKNDLAVTLPLSTVEQFLEFDQQLSLETKEKSFKILLTNQIIGVETAVKSISIILTALLSKNIQLQYTACGREVSGHRKKNFSNTTTYKCMKDNLVEKFAASEKEILSKTSRWFTGAPDRAGGRKERYRSKELQE